MSSKNTLDNQLFLRYSLKEMSMQKVSVWQFTCERCEESWIPRDAESDEPKKPMTCPKCKSPYWNTPRKNAKVATAKEK